MTSQTSSTIVTQNIADETLWLDYFSPKQALVAVAAHIAALPSSRTKEKHTARVYESGLKYFINWVGDTLPTADIVDMFIGHLAAKGLKSSTIRTKYMAPLRLYLTKLARQRIDVSGAERDYVQDCRAHIRAAAEVKSPRDEETSNLSPLWRYGKRLSFEQVNAILRSIDRRTISGLRDYALIFLAFESAMRLAELNRLTLTVFERQDDGLWLIRVRGKRNNIDPIPVSDKVVQAVLKYVDEYNKGLPDDDPRRITQDTALWQPMRRGDNYSIIGTNNYDPNRGMSVQMINNLIGRISKNATGLRISPHDTRRTAAAIAYKRGMQLNAIQKLLRHKDPKVTMNYIGDPPDYKTSCLATWVQFG